MEGGRTCLCISLHGACVLHAMTSVYLCTNVCYHLVYCTVFLWNLPESCMHGMVSLLQSRVHFWSDASGQSTKDITFHIRKLMPSSVAKIQLAPVVLVGAICGCFMEGQAGNSALRQPGGGGGGGGCGGMIRRSGF